MFTNKYGEQLKIIFWKISGKKTLLINEASGLGDYLWVRSYFRWIKQKSIYKDYKLIFCGTERWASFATNFDHTYVDAFLFFKDPYNPSPKESFVFKFIIFDVFINFRKHPFWSKMIGKIRYKKLFETDVVPNTMFYREHHNYFMSKIVGIPPDFQHDLPYSNFLPNKLYKWINEMRPYIIIVPSGYTVGALSGAQLAGIITYCQKKYNCNILFLGLKTDNSLFLETYAKLTNKEQLHTFNACGMFPMASLPFVVYHAKFIISVNTSIYHMAILLQKQVVCCTKAEAICRQKNVYNIVAHNELSSIPLTEIINRGLNNISV